MSEIVQRLRGWCPHDDECPRGLIDDAADEIERLRAELDAAIKQRDDARRDACLWALPKGVVWNESMLARGKAIASERGWDCFAQEGGGA
jgi:hypothetical protein